MASGTIVRTWQDGAHVYMAVRVVETTATGTENVEYIGSVPLGDLQGLTLAQQKAAIVAAVKQVRDAQQAGSTPLGIAGTVTL